MIRLVLLPGMHGTVELFGPFLRALPPGTVTSAVSYPRDRLLGYDALRPFVEEAAAGPAPCALVAESFSGPLAILHAADRPPNLRALVLCATFAANPLPASMRWLRGLARPSLFRGRPPRAVVRSLLAGSGVAPDLLELVAGASARADPAVMAHRLRQVMEVDVRSSLAAIRVPVLYLAGSADRLVGMRGLPPIAARVADLTTVVLEGPHLLLQARPEESAREIGRFLQRVA